MAPLFSIPSFLALVLSVATATASPHLPVQNRAVLPPMYFLAGDSTTAPDGGWGDGFVRNTILAPASGTNYGASGTTLGSFRAKGIWATILAGVKKYNTTNECIVTIQFGHNDQKNAVDEAAYSSRLTQYVADVNAAGGVPVIVTPMTRRSFNGSFVIQNLANETAKALAVAAATSARFINFNNASTTYVNEIGEKAAQVYNLSPSDHTHLNTWGATVFSRMVSDLLVAKYADIKAYTKTNATLSALLAAGKPA